jgi:nucleotide-binding universal stress UspA family protein
VGFGKRIVVGLDGSSHSGAAVRVAAQIASRVELQRLVGLHVLSVTQGEPTLRESLEGALGVGPRRVGAEAYELHRSQAEPILAEFRRFAGHIVGAEARLVDGALMEALERESRFADLFVAGLRGRTEDREPGRGGALWLSFLHDMALPVLLVPKGAEGIGRIAVGVDGSAGSAQALREVRWLAPALGVPVHLIHIGRDHGLLERVAADLPGVEVHQHAISGDDPHLVLANAAVDYGCDALVLGFRRQNRLKDFLVGSATEYIVLNSRLTVLVAH